MEYSQMELSALRDALNWAKGEKDRLSAIEKEIKDEIIFRHRDALAGKMGTVTIDRIKFNVPKKVEWDQDKLAALYSEIGETAPEYIDTKYSVSETKYKSWPSAIADQFEPARTVKAGATTFEFIGD